MNPFPATGRWFPILFCLGTLAVCVVNAEPPRAKAESPQSDGVLAPITAPGPISPARLQLEVMDFSDSYINGMWSEIDALLAGNTDPARRVAALAWKLRYGSASMEIATGADPRTNLLDMAIFISAGKWALDRYWIPGVFGEEAAGLRRHYRAMDRQIWSLVAETLTEEQTQLLRALIDQWIAGSPKQFEVSSLRFRNLEGVNPADFRREKSARGLLASVRRWLGEVNTSLLFGERVLFYVERTPRILNQQTDLTLAQIANDFPITRFNPDPTAITSYLDALPGRIQAGLDAHPEAFKEVLPGISGALGEARQLVTSSTELVVAGRELATTLTTSLDRLNALPAPPNSPPVDFHAALTQTTTALNHLDSSIRGLNELLAPDKTGGSKLTALVDHMDGRADRLMDRAFERVLWVMGFFFGGVALLLVLARVLFRPMRKNEPARDAQPAGPE